MKTKQLFFFTIASLAMLVSCSENKEDGPMLELASASTISAPGGACERNIIINCNIPWEATADVPWCTFTSTELSVDQTLITIHVEANPIVEERTANILIQAGSLSEKVTLVQAVGNPTLSINSTFIELVGEESSNSIAVTSNASWTATVNDAAISNWCTVTPSGFGDGTITVSVAENPSYARRYAFITVVSGDIKITAIVFQNAGKFYPDQGVTINGITWATRNIDAFATFADSPTATGRYYQFNRTIGYSYIDGNVTPAFDNNYVNENIDWNFLNDPCPGGWRLPTAAELENLRTSGFHWIDEPAGAWFGPDAASATFDVPGNAIFLPAKGLLHEGNMLVEKSGAYWTNTQGWAGNLGSAGRDLRFSFSGTQEVTGTTFTGKDTALLLRCVKE